VTVDDERDEREANAVYMAEAKIARYDVEFRTLAEARAYAYEVVGSRWWRARWPHVAQVYVTGSRLSYAHAERWPGCPAGYDGAIYLPRGLRSRMTVLHELAHLVQPYGSPDHGRAYRRTLIALVRRWLGREPARKLRDALKRWHCCI